MITEFYFQGELSLQGNRFHIQRHTLTESDLQSLNETTHMKSDVALLSFLSSDHFKMITMQRTC